MRANIESPPQPVGWDVSPTVDGGVGYPLRVGELKYDIFTQKPERKRITFGVSVIY